MRRIQTIDAQVVGTAGGPLQSVIDSVLLSNWGNTAMESVQIQVPPATTLYTGSAAPQGELVGGGSQVYIPQVNPTWISK